MGYAVDASQPDAAESEEGTRPMSTPDQVRERFRQEGMPLSQWARENGYQANKVYRVMAGIDKGYYGKAHEIAVKLGLKPDPAKS